jgi:hypothetical protein
MFEHICNSDVVQKVVIMGKLCSFEFGESAELNDESECILDGRFVSFPQLLDAVRDYL